MNHIPASVSPSRDFFVADYDDSHGLLHVEVPNGWDDVRHLQGRTVEFAGLHFRFTSWCSDRNRAYFVRTSPRNLARLT